MGALVASEHAGASLIWCDVCRSEYGESRYYASFFLQSEEEEAGVSPSNSTPTYRMVPTPIADTLPRTEGLAAEESKQQESPSVDIYTIHKCIC